ncbi:MAG: hypothetical protein Q9187_003616 [Circinaria calcarea]
MEEVQKKHRLEQKDLQNKITQKKKSATKKTRKSVNNECAELERQMKERQDRELLELNGELPVEGKDIEDLSPVESDGKDTKDADTHFEECNVDPSSKDTTPQNNARKPNRQKARLARRAAEQEATATQAAKEAANLPNLREQERVLMSNELKARGLVEQTIRSDGHCLYSAFADQLAQCDMDITQGDDTVTQPAYRIARHVAAKYIANHSDDFSPFLEEPLEEYIVKVRDTGEWGGQLELSALARAYEVKINVLQADGRIEKIEPDSARTGKAIWITYYRHSFGLGEHYNSTRRVP